MSLSGARLGTNQFATSMRTAKHHSQQPAPDSKSRAVKVGRKERQVRLLQR